MRRLRLFVTSVAHTPGNQLAARARLSVKRKALEALARVAPIERRAHGDGGPRLRDDLPLPPFPVRRELLSRGPRGAVARYLGLEVDVEPPVDWTRPSWRGQAPLELMTLHYMEWAETLDDAAFARTVDDWIARVRPYGPSYWLGAWNGYALSIRCVVWLQQLAARRSRLDPAFVERCARSIVAQLRFLARNLETDIRGNHLVRNVKALLWGRRAFEGEEAERWGALGERHLRRELSVQVLADGVHFERSPAYHAQVLADLLECAAVLDPGPSARPLEEAADAMAQALADLTHPDGGVSLFGDGGLHMSYAPALVLGAYERLRGVRPSPRAVAALTASGFHTAREGDDLLVVKCGRIGDDGLPAHAHGDALAFEWSVAGRRLVVDAGVFEYHAGPMRAWERSTRAHNTVTVADADQAEFYGSFRVGRRPHVALESFERRAGGFVLRGSHDGFRSLPGAPVHRRVFDATARRVHVRDLVEGGAGQPVRARLLLHPDTLIERISDGAVLVHGPARARLSTASPVSIERSWWCPDFGVKREAPQVVLDYGGAPTGGAFVLERLS